MNINDLKSQLARFGIRPNKQMGQNFLLSEKVLDEIVAAAEIKTTDTVLEIGPGLGALTRRLADKAGRVIVVEKDRKIYVVLRKLFKNKKNVKMVRGDALFFDFGDLGLLIRNYKVVANIPYYITGKLLQNFLTATEKPSLMVLLLQKEVAERVVAKPGEMSLLSVSAQFYSDPEIISLVGRENFYPIPAVDSAVVLFWVLPRPRFDVEERRFFQLVKIGFSNKRKQLHNNLTAGLPSAVVLESRQGRDDRISRDSIVSSSLQNDGTKMDYKAILVSIGLNPLCRAQDLSLDDWKRLFDKLSQSML